MQELKTGQEPDPKALNRSLYGDWVKNQGWIGPGQTEPGSRPPSTRHQSDRANRIVLPRGSARCSAPATCWLASGRAATPPPHLAGTCGHRPATATCCCMVSSCPWRHTMGWRWRQRYPLIYFPQNFSIWTLNWANNICSGIVSTSSSWCYSSWGQLRYFVVMIFWDLSPFVPDFGSLHLMPISWIIEHSPAR